MATTAGLPHHRGVSERPALAASLPRQRSTRAQTEQRRLAALHRRLVLDTPSEPVFDDIAALARDLCQVPVAGVAFLDRERNWFKAMTGTPLRESPREISFCREVVEASAPLVLPDVRKDARFVDNPLVTGAAALRAYAGAPVVLDGYALGTVCVFDVEVRRFSTTQISGLERLARLAATALVARTVRPTLSQRLQGEEPMGDGPDLAVARLTRMIDLDGPPPAVALRRRAAKRTR